MDQVVINGVTYIPASDPAVETDLAGCSIIKSADEQRYTLSIAYPALKADVATALDGRRDFVTPDILEKSAWQWMAKHRSIGLHHQEGTEGHGTVVESYIWRGPDWIIKAADGSEQEVKKGDWLLGVQWDVSTWSLIKSGRIGGYSFQGGARCVVPSAEMLNGLR